MQKKSSFVVVVVVVVAVVVAVDTVIVGVVLSQLFISRIHNISLAPCWWHLPVGTVYSTAASRHQSYSGFAVLAQKCN